MESRSKLLFTPDVIQRLEPGQVFVFGSNRLGKHGKGGALFAFKNCGAIYGQAEGLQGESYAIITKELRPYKPKVTLYEVEKGIRRFLEFATTRPDLQFLVTKIGCQLAGFDISQIAGLFRDNMDFERHTNVVLPREFWLYIS